MAGWETYNIAIPLEAWLSHYKPSVITNRDVSWLHIQSSVHPPLYDVGNVDAAKEDWNRYLLFSLLFSLSPLYPSLSPLSLLSSPFLYIIPFLSLTSHPLFFFGSKSNMRMALLPFLFFDNYARLLRERARLHKIWQQNTEFYTKNG